jgi:iron complex outermembrane receptor protein
MMSLVRRSHATLVCLLSSAVAFADPQDTTGATRLKSLSLEELSAIEVTTVSREPRRGFQTPAAIHVLTQEQIRRSGARTLPDLLRLVPGVHVAQIDSVQWAVGIRGFQGHLSKSVLVLIDGRSVYTPLFAGVYWEMQDTLLRDVDRIEVIRGPGGTIWGPNAVNGVINIITKSAKDTHGLTVSAGGGNVEQAYTGGRYGGGSDRLHYRVYGKGFTRSPLFHPDRRNFDDWRMGQAGFRMDWERNERDTLTVLGDAYSTIAGSIREISSFSPPSIRAVEANAQHYGQNVGAHWQHAFESGSHLQVHAYYDRTDRQDLNYREIRHTVDASLLHRVPVARHRISWGLGARVSPSRFFQTTDSVNFLPHRQTYNILTGFIEDDIEVIPNRLSFIAGTKLLHNTFSGFDVQPSAQVAWTPSEQQTVWGAVTRAVRTPSRIEDGFEFNFLAQPSLPLYFRLVGDGEFTSEQLVGYELGYRRYLRRHGFLGVAAFYNRYDDLLSVENRPIFVENSPPPAHLVLPLYLRNGVQAATSGIEPTWLWDLTPWWRTRGSYSLALVDARNKPISNDASTVGQLEGDSPRHKVILQSSFQLSDKLDLSLTYRYVSAVPNQVVPSYSTGDVQFSWQLTPQLELSVTGRNLLQPHHVEYGDNPGPLVGIRRSGHLSLTWSR